MSEYVGVFYCLTFVYESIFRPLEKYYTPHYLKGYTVKNNGEVDSYYMEGNHPPIVSKEIWDKVQEQIVKAAEEKGNMYYVEKSHPAIIDKEIWKAVQLEMRRRKDYMESNGIRQLDFIKVKSGARINI